MKRMIRAAKEGYKGFKDRNDYANHTRRDEIKFDNEEVWSIQFYNKGSDLIDDCEVYILADTYNSAKQQAAYLCRVWDYDLDDCVIQYAYKDRQWFNRHAIKLEGYVEYVEE